MTKVEKSLSFVMLCITHTSWAPNRPWPIVGSRLAPTAPELATFGTKGMRVYVVPAYSFPLLTLPGGGSSSGVQS
jgi:hypothetical protein